MPGKLYFYSNFGTIKRNKANSKVKYFERPLLRDVEWMFFYLWEETKGFSGFEDDDMYSCHRALVDGTSSKNLIKFYCLDDDRNIDENLINTFFTPYYDENGERIPKIYVDAREYLRRNHEEHLGKPLYLNQSKNMMMLGSRGFGKSYMVGAGIVAHEFLFDGETSYERQIGIEDPSAEILVGAADAKYSADLLDKTLSCLAKLPGGFTTTDRYGNEKVFPSPFHKNYKGSFQGKGMIEATYRKLVGGA